MATGGREQSSRDDCREECRRQTISPPDPEITLRWMTSRSTVTQPAGRDVGSAYQIETPPASPQYRDVNARELEHCRQRGANVTKRSGVLMHFGHEIRDSISAQSVSWSIGTGSENTFSLSAKYFRFT